MSQQNIQFRVRDLKVAFRDRSKAMLFGKGPAIEVLHGINLDIEKGDSIGIVGESGSGKSTLARALLRLVNSSHGTISFDGKDITGLDEIALRPLRKKMQIIFQDSQSSLNPRRTVGAMVAEPLLFNKVVKTSEQAKVKALALLAEAGLDSSFHDRYAHQLSGGQRQRVGVARAMAVSPEIIVADEIVSGLDVSVQAQILELISQLQLQRKMTLILISHDLSVVRAVCNRVVVMKSGNIVEQGTAEEVFDRPRHSYTRSLLNAIPLPEVDKSWIDRVSLDVAS